MQISRVFKHFVVALLFINAGQVIAGPAETIHVQPGDGEGADFTTVHRGEPGSPGPPPAVYINGVNVNDG